jgi:hypothetical protein
MRPEDAEAWITELVGTEPPEPVTLPPETRMPAPLEDPFAPPAGQFDPAAMTTMSSSWPNEGFKYRDIATHHEGIISYAPCWNFFVRTPKPGSIHGLTTRPHFLENVPPERTPEMTFLATRIVDAGHPFLAPSEEAYDMQEYIRLLFLWAWLKNQDLVWDLERHRRYTRFHPTASGFIGAKYLAEMWKQEGTFLMGACNSASIVFATLLLAIGMAPWRLGIFTARYASSDGSGAPSHVYNGIYLFNRWRYIDVQGVKGSVYPARTEADERPGWKSLNIGVVDTCDYAHPFSGEMARGSSWGMPAPTLPAVPLLGAAPYEVI